MADILFLAHRMPFPPDRGDKIRSHHLLGALAKLAPVHVGCFGDTDADFAHEDDLARAATSHCLIRRSKSMTRAGAEAMATGKPVSLTAFYSRALQDWVTQTIETHSIQTIVIFSGQMGQYIPDNFNGRVVVDLCDVDSAKFEAYAKDRAWPRNWIDAREGRLLSAVEENLSRRADCTLFVSEAEAELFQDRLVQPPENLIASLRNGIDADFFDSTRVEPQPELAGHSGPNLVFTGQMDYAPNIAAAERMIDRLLPEIRKQYPGAMFHLVGRAPVPRLLARDGKPGVRVWGEVPDVRPFLAAADIVVAPLEIARGVQNKVLEAMAMARPVVLSQEAATGIDAVNGEHFAIGSDDRDLIERICALLGDGPAALLMAAAARRYVVNHQSWPAMLAPLADFCGFPKVSGARDAA